MTDCDAEPALAITDLLRRSADGDEEALAALYQATYVRLQKLAHSQRAKHRAPPMELNTTALVHETFLKFGRARDASFADREHFFAVAARAMRQLLVDQARVALASKRGGGAVHIAMEDLVGAGISIANRESSERILDLNEALEDLGTLNERRLRVVECKVFAGMAEPEIARGLNMSVRTVRREWAKARLWLSLRLDTQNVGADSEG